MICRRRIRSGKRRNLTGDTSFPVELARSASQAGLIVTRRRPGTTRPVERPAPQLLLHARSRHVPDDPLTGFIRALARWKARIDFAERSACLTASERRGMFVETEGRQTADEVIDYEIIV